MPSTSCCRTAPAESLLASVTNEIFAPGTGKARAVKLAIQDFASSNAVVVSGVHFKVDCRLCLPLIMPYKGINFHERFGIDGA